MITPEYISITLNDKLGSTEEEIQAEIELLEKKTGILKEILQIIAALKSGYAALTTLNQPSLSSPPPASRRRIHAAANSPKNAGESLPPNHEPAH